MNNIYAHFSKNVNDYDTVSEKVVMKNTELHNALVGAISLDSNAKLDFLDLGCGTGHGMSLILDRFKNSKITGVDFSKKMIEKSKNKLSEFKGRFNLIEQDFNFMELGKNRDAIVSAIAIHNSTDAQKKELFKKIFNSLKTEGIFVNGDFTQAETPELDKQYHSIYRKYIENNLEGHELEVWLKHAFEEDMPMKLSEQFRILKEIGFKEIKLLWQFNNEAVYCAKKK